LSTAKVQQILAYGIIVFRENMEIAFGELLWFKNNERFISISFDFAIMAIPSHHE
jgi:hypothetical protein